MGSKNISIREEAYDFLSSIKNNDESFSDVILRFKQRMSNKDEILKLFDEPRAYTKSIDTKRMRQELDEKAKKIRKQLR